MPRYLFNAYSGLCHARDFEILDLPDLDAACAQAHRVARQFRAYLPGTLRREDLTIEIYQYPTEDREASERERVYSHNGSVGETVAAFAETFKQLYEDRDTDEFEFNWRQPFPFSEYEEFRKRIN